MNHISGTRLDLEHISGYFGVFMTDNGAPAFHLKYTRGNRQSIDNYEKNIENHGFETLPLNVTRPQIEERKRLWEEKLRDDNARINLIITGGAKPCI